MATLSTLTFEGRLIRYEPSASHIRHWRLIYMTPHFQDWAINTLSQRKASQGITVLPYYQLVERFDAFYRGENFTSDRMFRILMPVVNAVWEIKSSDVRIFGYFVRRNCFIAVSGEMKSALRLAGAYQKHIGRVIHIRERLGMEWIKGTDYADVV